SIFYSVNQYSDMSLFDPSPSKISSAELHQLKNWAYETLALDQDVPISISQLKAPSQAAHR
ncbi:MAG: hypothetical protein AAF810_26990, partial [Cyanobacteria bacterium P01_D01_bin.36]